MRVLVLGSQGQIGQYLIDSFKFSSHDLVLGFDLTDGPEFDLRKPDNDYLDSHLKWADFVYFLSFDVGGSAYLANQQFRYEYLDNNVKLMHNTFKALKKHQKPFIFASSQMSNMTNSSYGTLKNLGEFYTRSLNGINVRFWNVYGEEFDPKKFHVITDFIRSAKDHQKIEMRTDGHESRQFLFGEDAAVALHLLMQRFEELDPTLSYDITSFEWTTILELADLIGSLTGAKVFPGTESDMTQTLKNEPSTLILDYWKPSISLVDGITKLIEV